MVKRYLTACVLAGLLATSALVSAQVTGIALATWQDGNVFEGWYGPWRLTETGVQMSFSVLCYQINPRTRALANVIADVPDGTTLAQLRALLTTAIVDGCAEVHITVPRAMVFLPVLQAGQ